MKKNIFLILFATVFMSFSVNAQCCKSSKTKGSSCCAKKASTTANTETDTEVKAIMVSLEIDTTDDKTEKFIVYGNCGMCERTIENSLKEVEGISKGDWDRETDEMTVVFNPEVITLDAIKQKIADVGYDSDTHRAKEEVYNNLPGCCQYERPGE